MRSKGTKSIADNRKARHDYFVLEEYFFGRGGGHDLELWRSQRAGGGANGTGRG